VFQLHTPLIGNGGDAELEPLRITKARRNNGKLHFQISNHQAAKLLNLIGICGTGLGLDITF
jgi:hypothetical protein